MKSLVPTLKWMSAILVLFTLFSPAVESKLAFQTYLVSGKIISIDQSNAIELEDGFTYSASNPQKGLDIKPGQTVCLRYTVRTDGEKVYLEYALGANSLKEIQAPVYSRGNLKF